MNNINTYRTFVANLNEGSEYDKYAQKMYGKKWDDLERDKQSEVVDAVEGNYPLSKISFSLCCLSSSVEKLSQMLPLGINTDLSTSLALFSYLA